MFQLSEGCLASNLPSAQKWTLVALASFAGADGSGARPSIELLASLTSLHRRTVSRALAELRQLEIIEVTKAAGLHSPAEYQVHIANAKPAEHDSEYHWRLFEQASNIRNISDHRPSVDPYGAVYRRE